MRGGNQPERKVPIGGSERWQPIAPNGANLLRLNYCPMERTRSFGQDGSVRTRRIASSPPPRRQIGSGETAGAHRWRKRCLPAELTCGLRRAGTFAAAAQSSANPPNRKDSHPWRLWLVPPSPKRGVPMMNKMAVCRGERCWFARGSERLDTESQVRGKGSRRSKKETAPLGTAS